MLTLKKTALAMALALPMVAGAQTNQELKNEIELLKAQINELSALVKQNAATPAPAPATAPAAAGGVDPAEFQQLATKVDALIDDKEVSGFKGLRISAGIDPTYISNRATGTRSFAFLNNNSDINGSGDVFTYDNSTYGLAYLDFQKEMEGGTKLRLTLAPSKSAGSAYNWGNIVHEAYASVPLSDDKTRLLVGQMGDVSGYEPALNTYNGANSITANQLFPGYAESFVTKNLLFDFTSAYFYTGLGLDLTRGPWETRLYVANFNSARNGVSQCTAATSGNVGCDNSNIHPAFIYNATYAQDEFWGFEFTGYEGKVVNPITGGNSRLDQFEIDGNYTRGDINANAQFTIGQQQDAAYNGGNAQWWGVSTLFSQRVLPKLTLAARLDYIDNHKNGGGTFATNSSSAGVPTTIDNSAGNYIGDFYNGFGPGDPNAANYDPNKGANRSALSLSATYRLTPNVAFRAEYRYDYSTTPSFYYFDDQTFRNSNQIFGLQSIINF